jgi:hypothetical protein
VLLLFETIVRRRRRSHRRRSDHAPEIHCRARATRQAARQVGRDPAGEFIREQIDKIRRGMHGARLSRQAIAIGLSEARRAGVKLPPPKKGRTKASTRRSAEYDYEVGQERRQPKRRARGARAVSNALKHEPRRAALPRALSAQARRATSRRSAAARSAAARKAVRTKGPAVRSAAARKAARTRARPRRVE